MAQITGSSTIDWSGISLAQVDFETDIVTFVNRVDQIFTELNQAYPCLCKSDIICHRPFFGGKTDSRGFGVRHRSPIFNSFNFKNPPDGTGEVIRFTGTLTSAVMS